jgi:AhpD family alkylhydroperoxidase
MDGLNTAERELVALGAALGSNCVPCIEHHVPQARQAGLTDRQIHEAVRLADAIRRAPARKVLDTALELLSGPGGTSGAGQAGEADQAAPTETRTTCGDACAAPPSTRSDQPCCK